MGEVTYTKNFKALKNEKIKWWLKLGFMVEGRRKQWNNYETNFHNEEKKNGQLSTNKQILLLLNFLFLFLFDFCLLSVVLLPSSF